MNGPSIDFVVQLSHIWSGVVGTDQREKRADASLVGDNKTPRESLPRLDLKPCVLDLSLTARKLEDAGAVGDENLPENGRTISPSTLSCQGFLQDSLRSWSPFGIHLFICKDAS
jgi:hypothetical protein